MATELDQAVKEIKEAAAQTTQWAVEKYQPLYDEVERIKKSLLKAEEFVKEYQRGKIAKLNEVGRMRISGGKYAGFDLLDLRILEELYLSRIEKGRSDKDVLIPIRSARQTLKESLSYESVLEWEDRCIAMRSILMPRSVGHPVMNRFKNSVGSWTRDLIGQVTKAMDSTTAGKGDELVPTFEDASVWLDVNLATLILPLLPQMSMPTNPFNLPIQFGDTNWYPSTENVQVATTDLATQLVTLTAYGLKTGVPFSDELEEDAIISFISELRSSLVRNAAQVIDDVLLNGDTTLVNNINSDGVTIAATTAGKGHWLLGFDGIVHLPLVDNTAQRIDKNATIDADIFNRTGAKLSKYADASQIGDVVYIADIATAFRALSITEFETVDVAGAGRNTLSTGEIMSVYGIPLIRSGQMKLAQTTGLVASTSSANTTGRIICMNTTQWRVGFKRQIQVVTDKEPGKGQTTMYVSFRIALTERSGTRSSATHTALAYDITSI